MIKFKHERKELKPSLIQPKFLVCQLPPILAAIDSSMKVFGVKVAKSKIFLWPDLVLNPLRETSSGRHIPLPHF